MARARAGSAAAGSCCSHSRGEMLQNTDGHNVYAGSASHWNTLGCSSQTTSLRACRAAAGRGGR